MSMTTLRARSWLVARNRLLGFDRPVDRLAGGYFTAVLGAAEALADSGLEPGALTLEITETTIMRATERTAGRERAQALAAAGADVGPVGVTSKSKPHARLCWLRFMSSASKSGARNSSLAETTCCSRSRSPLGRSVARR